MTRSPESPHALLREVTRRYARAQRVLADCCGGTTSTQCHLLVELGRSGPLPPVELGERLGLEKSWVSRAIDGLARQGVVRKVANPRDARSVLVELTSAGRARVDALESTLDAHASRLLAGLAPRDRAQVERSLEMLLHALREDEGHHAAAPSTIAGGR